ncbi:AtpZ/AtpI family protein [Marinitenerispora sediminis]|uniref:Uncharacterized protein n=1 Tax=Marinitenerispora sediminis TaxID=1931232 RepID=A0A368T495_9ACTN|nr:hypothetical protein [Marinitenerispora sediminis]RCV56167.1 hypothetical protein DEF28_04295 [Marinitenerispora sediminis]RCV57507.1 hypothetical protein DEF23_10690 [Marinitenerispora sediminis]RCV57862.1 hypothetical protein DEF24_14610 [Marinitenerispora sediminis]
MNDRPGADGKPESRADGMTVVSYLLGGLAVWGGAGWLADWALGFETPVFLPIGLILGLVGAIYLIVTQYVRS